MHHHTLLKIFHVASNHQIYSNHTDLLRILVCRLFYFSPPSLLASHFLGRLGFSDLFLCHGFVIDSYEHSLGLLTLIDTLLLLKIDFRHLILCHLLPTPAILHPGKVPPPIGATRIFSMSICLPLFPQFSLTNLETVDLHYHHSHVGTLILLTLLSSHCPWLVKPNPLLFMHLRILRWEQSKTDKRNDWVYIKSMDISLKGAIHNAQLFHYILPSICIFVSSKKKGIFSPPQTTFSSLSQLTTLSPMPSRKQKPSKITL